MKIKKREIKLESISIVEDPLPGCEITKIDGEPVRKRSGNPEASSQRLKGKARKKGRPTEEDALGIVKGLSNVEIRRETNRGDRCGVILSEKEGGIIAMLCPFHQAKAKKWDPLTLQTRAASCEDCQRLTLALNKAAQRKQKEKEEEEDAEEKAASAGSEERRPASRKADPDPLVENSRKEASK